LAARRQLIRSLEALDGSDEAVASIRAYTAFMRSNNRYLAIAASAAAAGNEKLAADAFNALAEAGALESKAERELRLRVCGG
jgi:hypothetical protein